MQMYRRTGTVVWLSTRNPETDAVREMEAQGLCVHWARSICAAIEWLRAAHQKLVIVTELALPDGNWRDLVERVRCLDVYCPILLLANCSTAELWWDALECGIDDIAPGCQVAARV